MLSVLSFSNVVSKFKKSINTHVGRAALTEAELLAMLIRSGTPDMTAVDLAQQILDSVGPDLKRPG